jgi:hypothetical protein
MELTVDEKELMACVFRGLSRAGTEVLDRSFVLRESASVERTTERAAGRRQVHVSFKFSLDEGDWRHHGCLLVPYHDAIALASALLLLPTEAIQINQLLDDPDETMKEALLQLSEVFAAGVSRGLHDASCDRMLARSEGCQGVRPGLRPAFPFAPGTELLVAHTAARLGELDPFELILMLPAV